MFGVHRLDRGTSGVLLFALDADMARHIQAEFDSGRVDKRYLALVAGRWPVRREFVSARLDRYDAGNGERRVRVDAAGKVARWTGSALSWVPWRPRACARCSWSAGCSRHSCRASPASASDLPTVHIQRVSLERVAVEYVTAYGRSHFFDLHSLKAQAQAGQPFNMTLTGAVEKSFPYRLEFTGGPLQDLLRADQPWPIDLTLTFLSSTLTMSGTVSGAGGDIRFGLGTESLSEFERLFQTRLPPVGATAVAGRIAFGPRQVTLSQLAGVMGSTTMVGDLDFDSTGERPRITGSLSVPWLDLRPFLIPRPQDAKEAIAQMAAPPRSLADTYRELSKVTFSLSQLASLDADLSLQVGNWLSLPGEVRDASLQVKLEGGSCIRTRCVNVLSNAVNVPAVLSLSRSPSRSHPP